jgi:hypothetical protein
MAIGRALPHRISKPGPPQQTEEPRRLRWGAILLIALSVSVAIFAIASLIVDPPDKPAPDITYLPAEPQS